ncbi:MAG: O-antigen ligase family protein [Bacteroidota bacterium]
MITYVPFKKGLFFEHKFLIAILLAGFLSLLNVIFLLTMGNSGLGVIILPCVVLALIAIVNFRIAAIAIIIMLFVDYRNIAAVTFSVILGISFLIKYKGIEWKRYIYPLSTTILIAGISIIPSFLNAAQPFTSMRRCYNLLAFLVVLYSIAAGTKSLKEVRILAFAFLFCAIVNSFDIFLQSWTGVKRAFGFAGLMFVDYSALGVCMTFGISLITKRWTRLLFLSTSLVITIALLLTFTRNTWVSTIITLGILLMYIIYNPDIIGISRKRLVPIVVACACVLSMMVILIILNNSKLEGRATELTNRTQYGIDEWGNVENSMISRLFIWDTALNAFKAHPIIGIGIYSFAYSSQSYSRLPKFLYKRWVAKVSPHQTHLAILTETGIVGFIGFMIFIFSALKFVFSTIKKSQSLEGKHYAFVGAISLVYCVISMLFTDAWLSGQCLMLFGIVLGVNIAINKINVNSVVDQSCAQ